MWPDRDPELVLLHGGAQNAHTWDTVAMALDRPLVAIDLPGHGHSDGPGDVPAGQPDPHGNAVDVAAAQRSRYITDFIGGPAAIPSLDELLDRTARFNSARSRSGRPLRRSSVTSSSADAAGSGPAALAHDH